MSEIQVTKSILAKLLASENITVSHQNTSTAYFDLKSRTLVCPIWKDMDGDLYDLLMGHEVGHALETPENGWHNAVAGDDGKPVNKKFKSFLNVIEDARIEKKIKRRYPGLGKSFANAYKGLYERNFFGIKNIDVSKLNLIDRINIRFKLGAHVAVPFNEEERALVREVELAETWEQVEDIARRTFEYVAEKEQDKILSMDGLIEEDQRQKQKEKEDLQEFGDQETSEENIDDEDFDDYDDAEEGEPGGESDEESEEQDQEDPSTSPSNGYEGDDQEQPESITDRIFRKRESELVNASGKVYTFNLPEANLDQIIVNNRTVMNDLELWLRLQISNKRNTYGSKGISYDTVAAKCVRKFNQNNKKYITHILKEFDMRKKASAYARTQTARTGELNMNSLHNYKFTNDIFKKIAVVPKGKNHGMMLFLDMSGSMTNIFKNTIEQLLVLVSFCKMANIPFEVYGFSDAYYTSLKERKNLWDFNPKTDCNFRGGDRFHLKHLIGSSLSPIEYRRSFTNLAIVMNEWNRCSNYYANDRTDTGNFDHTWAAAGLDLNGTPFVETLLASRELIKNFRNDHKLDIANVIYLTDGDGGPSLNFPAESNVKYWEKGAVFYFVDKKTKKKVRLDDFTQQQAAMTELVRQVTGCKHIGFYMMEERDTRYVMSTINAAAAAGQNKYTAEDVANMRKSLKENRFFSCANLGYDNYFYMLASSKKIEEEKMEIVGGMTKNKMAKEFSKAQISKRSSRVLISKFAEEIATAA